MALGTPMRRAGARTARSRKYVKRRGKRVGMRRRFKKGAARWKRDTLAGMSSSIKNLSVCKTFRGENVDPVAIPTRILYYAAINKPPMVTSISSTTGIAGNARLRNVINMRGWKFQLSMRNELREPLWMNWAIVSPRGRGLDEQTQSLDFFRDHTISRDVGFGPGLSSTTMNFAAINTDKYFVLRHKRWFLPSNANTDPETSYADGSYANTNYRYKEFYLPFKRPVAFDDDNSTLDPETPVWMMYWFDELMKPSGTESVANAATVQLRCIGYYREPKA